jgi:hypothetical protein
MQQRDARIIAAEDAGETVRDIAEREGISRQSAHSILYRHRQAVESAKYDKINLTTRTKPYVAPVRPMLKFEDPRGFAGSRWCSQCDGNRVFTQALACKSKFCKVWEISK